MTRLLLVVQLATLALVGWGLLREPPGLTSAHASAERAQALEGEGAYAAAALAFDRAAAAVHGPVAEGFHESAQRNRALAQVAAPDLPGPDAWAALDALAVELEASSEPETTSVSRLLRLALARARGQRAEAETLVTQMLEKDEKSPWFQWHAGALRLEQGRVSEAQQLLEALGRARPQFGAGLHRLALTYAATEQYEAAIGALQRATAAGAGVGAEVDLGRLFLKRELWGEGLPHLENALRSAMPPQEMAEAVRLVAVAHFHLNRYDLAARTYRKAYDIDQEPRTLLSVAVALTAGGKYAEATEVLDTLAPRAAQIPEITYQQALVAAAEKKPVQGHLERYLVLARGQEGEAERIKLAEAALQKLAEAPVPGADSPPPPPQ